MAQSKRLLTAASLALLLGLPHAVLSAEAPAKKSGDMLVNQAGMTLYVFDKDQAGSGKSVCNGGCAAIWAALGAPADAKSSGDYSVVTRDDGSKQWAYKGRPLYQWAKDQKPGDTTGDGFNGAWHVVKD